MPVLSLQSWIGVANVPNELARQRRIRRNKANVRVDRATSEKMLPGENGKDHLLKGDGIPDGVVKLIKPAGANRPDPKPKSKDGNVEKIRRGWLRL